MFVLWSDLTGSSCCEYHMQKTSQSKSTEIYHFSSLISLVVFHYLTQKFRRFSIRNRVPFIAKGLGLKDDNC